MKTFCTVVLCVSCLWTASWSENAWAGKPSHAGGNKTTDTSTDTTDGSTSGDGALLLTFEASSLSVAYGGSVDLFWASLESQSCEASGAWSGRKDRSGSETIPSITSDAQFALTCKRKKYSVTESLLVTVDPASVPAPTPTVDLTSSADSVVADENVTLSWSSQHASVCRAGGAWQGEFGGSGSQIVGPLLKTSSFDLTCEGDGGSARDAVTVSVVAPKESEPAPEPTPTVSLQSDSLLVPYQGSANLSWSSQYASRCYAGGGWTGDLSLQGSATVGPLTSSNTYSVTCEGSGGTGYSAVTIEMEASGPVDVTSPGVIGDGRLDAIVEAIRSDYDIPALAVVLTRNGQVAEASATGLRALGGKDEVTLQDQWHLASLSKAITGTLIATQVEKSVISWNTRVGDVFPELVSSIKSQYANATLTQLLSHGAGLPANVWSVPSMSSGALSDSSSYSLPERRMIWAEELMAMAPEAPLGTYHYSNGGYIVAAAMLEKLTRDSWENLVRRHVLDPLGMLNTGFGAPGPNQPYGHRTVSGGLEPVPPGPGADNVLAMAPAAGIHTTVTDYASFMLAHLAGDHGFDNLVSASTYDYLHTARASDYGIGWFVWTSGTLSHTGSLPLWRSRVRIIPALDVGILVATNANNAAAQSAATKALELLADRASATP